MNFNNRKSIKMENFYFKHPSHFSDMFVIFENFYRSRIFSDVIITCQGKNIYAHRMVLCASSDHFRRILTSVEVQNLSPVLIINDISFEDMEIILEYIYRGQIVVAKEKIDSLRHAAHKLKVKGFENFLRRPFSSNILNSSLVPNSKLIAASSKSGTSLLLQDDQHFSKSWNGSDNKKLKLNNEPINYSTVNCQDEPNTFTQVTSQLESVLQRGLNGFKRLQNEQDNAVYDLRKDRQNHPLSMKVGSKLSDRNGGTSFLDSDENEENRKNEKTESVIEKLNQFNQAKEFLRNYEIKEDNNDDSDDSQEVNYTYEMDPDFLTHLNNNGDSNNYKISKMAANHDEEERMDEEDYFEESNRNSYHMKNSPCIRNNNNEEPIPENVFHCDHCSKFFYDEDHLQLHFKRTHGLNKINRCDICGKAYAWKSGLYKHKRHVHNIGGNGKPLSPPNENIYLSPESPADSQPSTPQSSMEVLRLANTNSPSSGISSGAYIDASA